MKTVKISTHPVGHAFEHKNGVIKKYPYAPALRSTDYKCPQCVWYEYR